MAPSPATARTIRRALTLAGAILMAALIAAQAVSYIPLLRHVEQLSFDFRTAMAAPAEPQDSDIVVIAITEDTLARFPYRSPIDRAFLSNVLKLLESRDVRAIGLDVLFDQATEPEKDDQLRRTIAELKVPLVVGYIDGTEVLDPTQEAFLANFVPPELRGLVFEATDPLDATVRWIYPGHYEPNGNFVPGFDYALAAKTGVTVEPAQVEIAWRGRPAGNAAEPFRTYDAHLLEKLPAGLFKHKIALVGAEVSLTDRHRTPFATIYEGERGILPGVLIHAHSLAQLLDGRHLTKPGAVASFAIVLAMAILGALLGARDHGTLMRLGGGALALAAFWTLSFALFHEHRLVLPLVAPSLALMLAVWAADSIAGGEARRQRAYITSAFSRLVSPKIVERLVNNPAMLQKLRGERREMTLLFTDIAGFTSMVEAVGPDEAGPLMNAYFDGVCNIVQRYDGTFDKFIGDAIFVEFNVLVDQPDHAARCVRCALEIDRFAEAFRAEQRAKGVPFGVTRIGVHTGVGIYGNFGSSWRQEFTALGDVVNIASRLEGANRGLGTRICVSDATRAQCLDIAFFRPLGRVKLKGKSTMLSVYEPLALEDADRDYVSRYSEAYAALERGEARAASLFQSLWSERPQDDCVAFQVERIKRGASGIDIVLTEK